MVAEHSRFLIRQWVDGYAIFDRQSGDTHALDPLTGAMFICARGGMRERSSILASMCSLCPQLMPEEIEAKYDGMFEQLKKLNLVVERVH